MYKKRFTIKLSNLILIVIIALIGCISIHKIVSSSNKQIMSKESIIETSQSNMLTANINHYAEEKTNEKSITNHLEEHTVNSKKSDDIKNIEVAEETTQNSEENLKLKQIELPTLESMDINTNTLLKSPSIENIKAGITKEEAQKYYYNQLKNQVSKNTYKALEKSTTNQCIVDLNVEYEITDTTSEGIVALYNANVRNYFFDGYAAYMMDGGYYWWQVADFGESLTYNLENSKIEFVSVEVTSKISEYENRNLYEAKLENAVNSITGENIYDITKSINQYICNTVIYKQEDDTRIDQTAYGALVNGKAVCEGQAQLFNELCRSKNIISIMVYGYAKISTFQGGHAWNYVYDENSQKWYAFDITWNNDSTEKNLYIMVGGETSINGIKFNDSHVANMKMWTMQTYIPESPELSKDKYLDYQIDVTYSEKKPTQGGVTVTIKSNLPLKGLAKWISSKDKLSLTRTFYTNTTETINIENIYGEGVDKTIDINNININEEDPLIFSSEKYTIEDKVITKIQPNTTLTEILNNITSNKEYTITEEDRVITEEDVIKTGQTLTVGDKSYTLVVTGDVNGDGKADIQDILGINKHRLNKANLVEIFLQAGDTNGDGKADIQDILRINKYRLNKIKEI